MCPNQEKKIKVSQPISATLFRFSAMSDWPTAAAACVVVNNVFEGGSVHYYGKKYFTDNCHFNGAGPGLIMTRLELQQLMEIKEIDCFDS